MFRRLFRAARHFLGAVVLVVGSICLIEVVLGVRHASQVVENQAVSTEALAIPSRSFFQELRPLAHVVTPFGDLKTNSYGLRGAEPLNPKPPGVYRILVLGDEATLAAHLADDETFCSQLQNTVLKGRTSLPVEVINGGQPAGCPLTLSLLYRQRLATLSPDAVVVVLSASDVTDDLRSRAFLKTDENGQPLACPHPSTGGREQPIDVWRSEFQLVDFVASRSLQAWLDRGTRVRSDLLSPNRTQEWLATPTGTWAGPIKSALEPLNQLKKDVEAQFGQFILTVAPEASAVNGPEPGWNAVAEFAVANGMIWIDPTMRLREFDRSAASGFFEPTEVDGELVTAGQINGSQSSTESTGPSRLSADGHRLLALVLATHFTSQPSLAVLNAAGSEPR